MVVIKWFGQACVAIRRSDGYTIVIDPHAGGDIGLEKPDVKADLVLVTHEHFDHNAVDTVSHSNTRILRVFRGETKINGITIRGYKTFHDKFGGRRRGENTVYVVEVEGYKLAHLGDLGHIPGADVMDAIKGVDLLMIPVGGTYTIYPDEAWRIVEETKPVNVLPIHYWVRGLKLPLQPIDDFLVHVKKYRIARLDTSEFELGNYQNSVIVLRLK
ncbi:MAG: Zn-dependent hydrolase [Thermoprotei archaeon]|nr:MAG: Zn-dependent hydrolase [Thermoprotei archaeon]